jgi:hypothetical protein
MNEFEYKNLNGKRILMVNSFEGGAEVAFRNISNELEINNDVTYIDMYWVLSFIPKKFRFLCSKFVSPFVSLLYQILFFYNICIMNQNIIFPVSLTKTEYYNIIHHSFYMDVKVRKIGLIEKMLLINEEISVKLNKNTLTDSLCSYNFLRDKYPSINIHLIRLPIDKVFVNLGMKDYVKEKIIVLPSTYKMDRKGGSFITPILISLKEELKEYKLIVTGSVCKSQENNFNQLKETFEIEHYEQLSIEEIGILYAKSLLVLYPSTLEGYGYIPLEVNEVKTFCLTSPVPSLDYDKTISEYKDYSKAVGPYVRVISLDDYLWKEEIENIIKMI